MKKIIFLSVACLMMAVACDDKGDTTPTTPKTVLKSISVGMAMGEVVQFYYNYSIDYADGTPVKYAMSIAQEYDEDENIIWGVANDFNITKTATGYQFYDINQEQTTLSCDVENGKVVASYEGEGTNLVKIEWTYDENGYLTQLGMGNGEPYPLASPIGYVDGNWTTIVETFPAYEYGNFVNNTSFDYGVLMTMTHPMFSSEVGYSLPYFMLGLTGKPSAYVPCGWQTSSGDDELGYAVKTGESTEEPAAQPTLVDSNADGFVDMAYMLYMGAMTIVYQFEYTQI